MYSASSVKSKLQLYSTPRSSCSWRVRIALHLKGLDFEYKTINLLKGEQLTTEFQKLNPLNYVPVLVDEDIVVADSFAIIMYLEDKFPEIPLLPQDLQKKALNYQVANLVASNIQPFQNLAVLNYIEEKLGSDEKFSWAQHHIRKGFVALEKLLEACAGKYATGDEIALADLFLAPQIGYSKKFNIDLADFSLLRRLNDAYSELPAFQNAMPEKHPGA
ncbi:glutathione S-transferase 2-like [Silene latifolia]|uniref:glutathione S-transferase 2-like n=1 Tax=Silene latifolia TaxID=37657 RepID=UPI003D77004C